MRLFLSAVIASFCFYSPVYVLAQAEEEAPLLTVSKSPDLETVPYVDIKRYQGRWYEIARVPNRFQEKCIGNVTANYALLDNGQVEVINTCLKKNGETEVAEGRGKVKDKTTQAKLKVSFFDVFNRYIFAFAGDYWVINLDQNYGWAVVGTPDRDYGWILSRTPTLDDATLEAIQSGLIAKYYDPCVFVMTNQSAKPGIDSPKVSLCK